MPSTAQRPAMNVGELAQALNLHRTTVARLVREGRIPQPVRLGYRTVRWPAEIVEQILRDLVVGGAAR